MGANLESIEQVLKDLKAGEKIICTDYSTLTVSSTALVMSAACSPLMPQNTKGAIITVETDQIRYRYDGTAPTSSEGHLLNPGDVLTFNSWIAPKRDWSSILKSIQVIRVTADAKLKISWMSSEE